MHKEGFGLEVKGAGAPHFHVMREEQLDEHLRALNFPLTHSCFLLFHYKNKRVVVEGKRKKRESTQLRLCGDRYTRRQHIATNMFGLDVVDTRLVAKWRDEKTLCQYPSDRSKKTPVFRIPRNLVTAEYEAQAIRKNGYIARREDVRVTFVDEDPQGHLFGDQHPPVTYAFNLALRWIVSHQAYRILSRQLGKQGKTKRELVLAST